MVSMSRNERETSSFWTLLDREADDAMRCDVVVVQLSSGFMSWCVSPQRLFLFCLIYRRRRRAAPTLCTHFVQGSVDVLARFSANNAQKNGKWSSLTPQLCTVMQVFCAWSLICAPETGASRVSLPINSSVRQFDPCSEKHAPVHRQLGEPLHNK